MKCLLFRLLYKFFFGNGQAYNAKWMSVEERLPKQNGMEVLLNWVEEYDFGDQHIRNEGRCVGTWVTGMGFDDGGGGFNEDCYVTHWMEIEPPC